MPCSVLLSPLSIFYFATTTYIFVNLFYHKLLVVPPLGILHDIAVCKLTSPLWEITYHMGSHSVTCHPAEVTFLPLPQPKLVLDLATPKGCKAELTWVVVTSQDSIPARNDHLPQKKLAIPWLGFEPTTASRKSDNLTTTPLSHLVLQHRYRVVDFSLLSFLDCTKTLA